MRAAVLSGLEKIHVEREKEWRERDSLRAAAIKDRPVTQAPAEESAS